MYLGSIVNGLDDLCVFLLYFFLFHFDLLIEGIDPVPFFFEFYITQVFDLQFSYLGGQARAQVTDMELVCKCCSLKRWKSYAEGIAKNGPQDQRAKLAGIVLTLVREREDWEELVDAARTVLADLDDEDDEELAKLGPSRVQ